MPRREARKGDVCAIPAEHDAAAAAATPGSAGPQTPPAPASLALLSPGRRHRGVADRLDSAVVLRSLDRERSIGGVGRFPGPAWPRFLLPGARHPRAPLPGLD